MTLLFVANFGPDVGYAWHTITAVYRAVGRRLASAGVRTLFCFPEGAAGPDRVIFDYAATRRSPRALFAFLRLLRRERVRVLYLTDLETWSWRYPLFHMMGVRSVVVHDRTSGARGARLPGALFLKRLLHAIPTLGADVCIGISQFVVERLVCVNGVRRRRAVLVYNGINVAHFATPVPGALHALLGVPPATRVVFASGRAQAYKGIAVFIEAAARLESRGVRDVAFAYCGDGPDLDSFRRLAAARGLRTFHFLGRRDDMPRLLGSAAVAVAPALWEEAFGLTVVEAMAAGVPVVATAVGGVPELVEAGRSGLLVPPGEAAALADAIGRLLDDPSLRAALAAGGREAARRFDFDMAVQRLAEVLVARLPAARPTRGAAPR